MKNLKKEYIRKIFTNIEKLKYGGIYLYGIEEEGEYKEWHGNGKLFLHCFYKNGELEGEYKSWHENGKLYSHSFYKDGRLNSEYKRWWDNGQLLQHGFWKNGKEEGEYKIWYTDGNLNSHSFYKDGKEIDMPDNVKNGYIYVDGKYYPDKGDIQ